jgi:hypothetical protein
MTQAFFIYTLNYMALEGLSMDAHMWVAFSGKFSRSVGAWCFW